MRRLRFIWVFLLAFLVFATDAVADEPPPAGDAETEEQLALQSDEELLLEAASSIAERVAQIRGLALKEPIPKGVKNREQLRAMLIERFHEEVPEEQFEAEARVYKRLGLFDEDLDYRQLMLDLLTEQIAGFYDQGNKELYIMEGLPEVILRPTMAHEIFHAIQDQHFDIGALLAPFSSQENGDFALARMALIEGDAFVLMFDFELWEGGQLPRGRARSVADIPELAAAMLQLNAEEMTAVEQLETPKARSVTPNPVPSLTDSVLGSAPPIVRDVLLFPYLGGMRFVLRARAGRSWEEFNRIYENAPVSTSQILHPERYFQGDYPLQVDFSAARAIPDFRPVYETVLGELQIRSWLNTHFALLSDPPSAADIASGWDGDRLRGYEGPDGEMIVVHLSTWRSTDAARDFARSLEETARQRHDVGSTYRSGPHGESWCIRVGQEEREGHRVYVERWGEMVLYIEGTPSFLDDNGRETDATTFFVRDAAWQSHYRRPFEEVLEERLAAAEEESEQTPQ